MENLFQKISELNEGWGIYHTYGREGGDGWQIEREDDANKFQSDGQAIKHVYEKALRGSSVHLDALEFMRSNASSVEFFYMCKSII
jgi:hypothetical protein